MSSKIKDMEHKLKSGNILKIIQDNNPLNPRTEWDNLGTMVCFHNRYSLGDKNHGFDSANYDSWSVLEKDIQKNHDAVIILPLYLYDHSGITISTKPFSCRWDSGQIGFIFVSKKVLRNVYGKKRISKKLIGEVTKYLENEVDTYDDYLTGNVWGFEVTNDKDEIINSCWGFFGEDINKNGILEHINDELVN